jgi:ribonuclease HI
MDNASLRQELHLSADELNDMSARQAFASLKGQADTPIMPLPHHCKLHAPAVINVFTDGTWRNPRHPNFSLGGAGVWWPGKRKGFSSAEKQLAAIHVDNKGARLCASFGGYAGSSTRTELAAAILACCGAGPIHLGTDSQAFATRAQSLIKAVARGAKVKQHWALQSDGDLWEYFYKAVVAKGPNAMRISWVKGHATDAHVAQGITTQANLEGNDMADAIADQGYEMHGERVVHFADLYSKRRHFYSLFYRKVVHHIIEGYLIHKELLRIKDAKEGQATQNLLEVTHTPLGYADQQLSQLLVMNTSIKCYPKVIKKTPNIIYVQDFLSKVSLQPLQDSSQRGITWIELYILYRIRGFPNVIQDKAATHRPGITIEKQFKHFKTAVKQVLDKSNMSESQRELFKPVKITKDNLKQVALSGKHPAVLCNVVLEPEEKVHMAKKLLLLGKHCTKKQLADFLELSGKLKPLPIQLKGKRKWDELLPLVLQHEVPTFHEEDFSHLDRSILTQVHCPTCKTSNTRMHSFNKMNLETLVKCKSCSRSAQSQNWLCPCANRWHMCPRHMLDQTTAPCVHKRQKTNNKTAKRPVVSLGQMLDAELERESKQARKHFEVGMLLDETIIELEPSSNISLRPGMLPSSLRERFSHVL